MLEVNCWAHIEKVVTNFDKVQVASREVDQNETGEGTWFEDIALSGKCFEKH